MKKEKIISVVLALIMLLSIALPMSVNAQLVYDPTATGNNGVYIDTSQLPINDGTNNIQISGDGDGKFISSKRNVKFKLYCPVDAVWSITAADENNYSVENGYVSIDDLSGEVKISNDATMGYYNITATAQNVEKPYIATIRLYVRAEEDPAMAKSSSIVFDKEQILKDADDSISPEQVDVVNDGKTLVINGKVNNLKMSVKYSPDYLLDNSVSFTSKSSEAYQLESEFDVATEDEAKLTYDDYSYITSNKETEGTSIGCQVGSNSTSATQTNLNVVIKRKDLDMSVVSNEIQGDGYSYSIPLDQIVHYNVVSNEKESLPETQVNKITWTLNQNSNPIIPSGSKRIDGVLYSAYVVNGTDGMTPQKMATIYVKSGDISDSIIVETEKGTSATTVDAVTLKGQYTTNSDNAANVSNLKTITLNFNVKQSSKPNKVFLDFEKAGLEKDKDYAVKTENLGGINTTVYYFESNGKNLDFSEATFADVLGVRSFEESKDMHFSTSEMGATYKINYGLSNLSDSVFGSTGTANNYNNNKLNNAEIDSSGLLVRNNVLTKCGVGYKVLTVHCLMGTTEISKNSYVLRFVSDSSKLNDRLKISKDANYWYSISHGEVVHIRRGEAVIPGFYEYTGQDFTQNQEDAISIYDPYIEYSVSDANVATATPNTDGTYRINGLESGLITVKAVGAVNKEDEVTFEVFVNKDIYESNFEISFADAIKNKQMSSAFVVDGKLSNIPVNVNALGDRAGIPILSWSLDCDPSVATIDPETGAITTKTSSAGQKITVTATSSNKRYSDSKSFTIADVEGTQIVTLSEKPVEGSPLVVTSTANNAGTCKVGNTFTLYPSSYSPVNATSLSGTIAWSSSNNEIATVNNGVVTALAETPHDNPVKITASYTPVSGGTPVSIVYSLIISGYANPIEAISANSLTFENKNVAGKSIDLTFTPENTPNKMVTYVSSDTSIATVSENGLVTPVGIGTCTITVTSVVNPEISTTVDVVVYGTTEPSSTEPSSTEPSSTEPVVPANNYKITTTLLNATISNSATSVDEGDSYVAIVTADSGYKLKTVLVTMDGKVVETAISDSYCAITVPNVTGDISIFAVTEKVSTPAKNPKTTVSLAKSSARIYRTGKTTIKVTVKNRKGTTTFRSSNSRIAKVNSSGVVTGVSKGTAKITVANNGVKKVFTVTVKNPSLNKNSVSIKKGKTFTLKITGKVGTAKFTSSNKKIATVNSGGKITGKKKGTTYVTVKTNGMSLKCKVKVK